MRLIVVLAVVWAALTFIPSYFARDLSFDFIGWPFSFWMAAYGAPLAYLVIICIYARIMNRADQRGDEAKESR
ncbi:putative solute-sodium symporter small subunit [Achromobacter ruhlandii]|nr:putative solute-sodium symporter small subunit [Achromobacter ruhlandii]